MNFKIKHTFYKRGNSLMINYIFCAVFLLSALWFMLPIFRGILHIGMIYPALLFLAMSFLFANPEFATALYTGRLKIFSIIVSAVIIVMLLISVIISVFMIKAIINTPKDSNKTVIVLGCQVKGSAPSRMLQNRINTAYNYLNMHKSAMCIASGGKGDDEEISEAECIKAELVKMGIDKSRIFLEDKSTTTAENLMYSKAIIENNNLSSNVAIASDNFHQLRAAIYAKKNNLTPFSLGCSTTWYLSAGYYAREIPAIIASIMRGY